MHQRIKRLAISLSGLFLALSFLTQQSLIAQDSDPQGPQAQYRLLTEMPCEVSGLTFSSNGSRLSFSCDGNVYWMGLSDTSAKQVTDADVIEHNPAWSPDGTKIAYQRDSSGISSIWVYSTISQVHTRVNKIKENCFDPSWAPNGRAVAFSTDTYGSVDVMIKDFDYNKERRLTAAKGDEYIFGFHPSGKFVGYYERGTEEEDLYAVSLTGKEALPLTRSTALEIFPKWSYDGSKVLFLIGEGDVKSIYTADFPYGELSKMGSHRFKVNPIISANGKRVIYQDEKDDVVDLHIYTLDRKESLPLGVTEMGDVFQMSWSIGGRIVAAATSESQNQSKLWLVNISQFVKGR